MKKMLEALDAGLHASRMKPSYTKQQKVHVLVRHQISARSAGHR